MLFLFDKIFIYNILGGEDWLLVKNTRVAKTTDHGQGRGWKITGIDVIPSFSSNVVCECVYVICSAEQDFGDLNGQKWSIWIQNVVYVLNPLDVVASESFLKIYFLFLLHGCMFIQTRI